MTRRVTSRLASALAGIILLTGCSQLGAAETGTTAGPAGKPLPATVPATFGTTAQWTADRVVPGSVRVTRYGVLAIFGGPEHRSVALLDATTGKPIWFSKPFAAASTPRMELVNSGGRAWVVVWHLGAPGTVRIATYDIHGSSRDGKQHTHLEDLVGDGSTPKVVATSGGLLISGVKDAPPFLLWPADGRRTSYGRGPVLNGQPGVPAAAYNGGFLVTFAPTGFSYASPSGGWPSDAGTPSGAVINSGKILKINSGLILAAWEQTVGGTVLAVHSIQSGEVLAQQVAAAEQPPEDLTSPFAVAPDHSWAAWGGYLFNLRAHDKTEEQQSAWHDLHGGEPVSIYQGVLYLRGVEQPFLPPVESGNAAPGCEPPSASGSANASGPASPSGSTSASGSASAAPSGSASPPATASPSPTGSPASSTPPCASGSGSPSASGSASASAAASASGAAPASPSGSASPSVEDSATPSATPQSGKPKPTPGVPEDFAGHAALDTATGVLVDQSQHAAPIGISTTGSGIFTTDPTDPADPTALVTLFSVPVGR